MTEHNAILRISGDPDGDGAVESGTFEMVGNLEVTPSLEPQFLLGGRQSQVNSIIANTVSDGASTNQQFFLDLGAGPFTVEINFQSWEGAIKQDGTPAQWGNEGTDDAPTKTDATGADPVTQICVLIQYLVTGNHDSRNPATLEWGEWSSSGLFDPLDVVVQGPSLSRAAQDGSWFSGSLTCIQAASVKDAYDAKQQRNP